MATTITSDQLDQLAPRALAQYIGAFEANTAAQTLQQAGISDAPLRVCHFMAQVMTESSALTQLSENLDYRASTLVRVWPTHFPTLDLAAPYAHDPEKLADFIYGQGSIAKALGNTSPGDGWLYRGRGLIQITGRSAYARFSGLLGVDLIQTPDLAFASATALGVACAEWANSGHGGKSCNQLADADDLSGVTYAINGGQNGLADRALWLQHAKAIWLPNAAAGQPASRAVANSASGRADAG